MSDVKKAMTRGQKSRERRRFLLALATEVESHLANESEFIFYDSDNGEEPSAEVVELRVSTLKQVARELRRRAVR